MWGCEFGPDDNDEFDFGPGPSDVFMEHSDT